MLVEATRRVKGSSFSKLSRGDIIVTFQGPKNTDTQHLMLVEATKRAKGSSPIAVPQQLSLQHHRKHT